ncbi:MAG: ATP-binding cassette domain-containing protein [Bacilli bacterium]|nr:ATP-binding cassette domain-containing protein [Bacilli bacterium]
MGWFEEQVEKRKKLDAKTFEDSFGSLAGIKIDNPHNLSLEELRENFAISQILSSFHHSMVDIPVTIKKFNEKLTYSLGQYGVEYHKVELNDSYKNDGRSILLIFTLKHNIPVVLFPVGTKEYYYINYKTGKKVRIKAELVNRLELEAYSFYRPLPNNKIDIKGYIKYISKSIRPIDIILLLLFSAAVSGVGILLPYLTKVLTGKVVQDKVMSQFVVISLYVVGAATGLVIIKAIQSFVNLRITMRIEKAVREATMMKLLHLPPSFFKKYNTGELAARFASVTSLAQIILNGAFTTIMALIMSIVYLSQLGSFVPVLILPVILILFVNTGFTIFMALYEKNITAKQLQLNSKESGVTYEMINGIQKIRLSGSEKRVFAKWAVSYSKAAKYQYNPSIIIKISPVISLVISILGTIVIYLVAAKNSLSASNYMAFNTSYGVLSGVFASLTSTVALLATISPVYQMARPILQEQVENVEGKTVLESVKGNIKLDNVSFRYNENSPLVVNDLSLEIHEGEYIAIVGPTGCGKSTLTRLLLGFEKPVSGEIYYDEHNIKDIDLISLRKNIGTVMQNGALFHADILSNIIISAPNLKEEDAWAAAEIANIADDIREMPMKMGTVISEGQGGISGGQKQRIMIARAIVHKPKILIFDEATSALDNRTQKSITESINKLNCTRIVIAHRLSTIKNADRILMLEGGKIIEQGSYQELIAKAGRFAELVERQRLDTNN